MIGYSYVIPRDYGFAPNPFGGICTLATCKPGIRNMAHVEDWVIGCGSKKFNLQNRIVFAMRITEIMTYDEYWADQRFQHKKPTMDSSLKRMYGDNIYHKENSTWYQMNSHHSNDDGSINLSNLHRDTKSDRVLLSEEFYYFGKSAYKLSSKRLSSTVTYSGRGYKKVDDISLNNLSKILRENFSIGIIDFPILFKNFKRYNGK
ncbi:hypothetical protein [Desulfovibrio sp.]|uniref:Nmad2 family putative nucleotide modification protein n=1 Tax=Desulfovibrio sp. TaxID=885 RepID=UPI0025C14DB0|nr:hypothetical protein [Desulfovibrio sp.]